MLQYASILKTNKGVQSWKQKTLKLAFESPPIENVGVNADPFIMQSRGVGTWIVLLWNWSFWFKPLTLGIAWHSHNRGLATFASWDDPTVVNWQRCAKCPWTAWSLQNSDVPAPIAVGWSWSRAKRTAAGRARIRMVGENGDSVPLKTIMFEPNSEDYASKAWNTIGLSSLEHSLTCRQGTVSAPLVKSTSRSLSPSWTMGQLHYPSLPPQSIKRYQGFFECRHDIRHVKSERCEWPS